MTDLRTDLVVHRHGLPLGDGPTLLFLHGLTDSGAGWPEAVAHWEGEFAIVAPDQRGHGRSPRFTAEELEAHPGEVMVDDAVAILEQLPSPPVVIGHSLGGAVALTAAVRRPELVCGLVLEDPAPLGPDEDLRRPDRGEEFLEGVRRSSAAPDDATLLAQRREEHPDWPESELLVTGHAEQQMDVTYLQNGDLKPATPWTELFTALKVPTLVVSGDVMEEVCVDAGMEQAIGRATDVGLVRLPGAGHCIRRERPDAYYAVVDEWLAGLGLP